jgi:exonuclease III
MNFRRKILSLNLNSIECSAKKSLLKDFVLQTDVDIIFFQEVCFQDFSFLYGFQSYVNLDEKKRGTAVLIRNGLKVRDVLLSECGRIISLVINEINFVNIYAKSGSQYKRTRDDFFLNKLTVHLNKNRIIDTVLAGDFNCILDPADMRGTTKNFCFGLRQVINAFRFKDVLLHSGNEREFTFYRGSSASRIDRFYVTPNFFTRYVDQKTCPNVISDHRAVLLTFNIEENEAIAPTGFGYWKVNSAILKQVTVRQGYEELLAELRGFQVYQTNPIRWWNVNMKSRSKFFLKDRVKSFNNAVAEQKQQFFCLLNDLSVRQNRGEEVDAEMNFVKRNILEIELRKLDALGLKMKSNVLAVEEKLNVFQLAKGKNQGAEIKKLKIGENVCHNTVTIREHIQEHFASLLNPQNENIPVSQNCLRYLNKQLSSGQAAELTLPITEDELKANLTSCARKKSPGPDGLTYEFYITFYDLLKLDLLKVFNSYLNNPELIPSGFAEGIITLIPKIAKPQTVKDFRPISLLNCDYKLFTKIIANRVKKVLECVIGNGQSACLTGRSCVSNVCTLRDLIVAAKTDRNLRCALLSLDFEKAFDRIRHQFLWKVLQKFGFSEQFIEILQWLYRGAGSKILVNGFMTRKIPITCSVRQGCPLSMILFVLFIEPLIRAIDETVTAVRVGTQNVSILAYADDVCYVVSNDVEADNAFAEISSFNNESGAMINLTKSSFLRVNGCRLGPQRLIEREEIKILGVKLMADCKKIIAVNYEQLISKITGILHFHAGRRQNLLQKIWFVNTFVLSKLWYISQIVPPENKHIAKIKQVLGRFLWAGSLYKIERNQLCMKIENGGLALVNIEAKTKALFAKTLVRNSDNFLSQGVGHINFSRNMREWTTYAGTIVNVNSVSTKSLYSDLMQGLNNKPRVETKFPEIDWELTWRKFKLSHIPTDWKMSMYLILNDTISNNHRMFQHNIGGVQSPDCSVCGRRDTNAHRIKDCIFSTTSWRWLKEKLAQRTNLEIDDPEELLGTRMQAGVKAGLWLLFGVVHYNIKYYDCGTMEEMLDGMRKHRWQRNFELERVCGTALNCF